MTERNGRNIQNPNHHVSHIDIKKVLDNDKNQEDICVYTSSKPDHLLVVQFKTRCGTRAGIRLVQVEKELGMASIGCTLHCLDAQLLQSDLGGVFSRVVEVLAIIPHSRGDVAAGHVDGAGPGCSSSF